MGFTIKKDIAYRRVGDDLFIVDAAASRLHELNGPAALIWEGLAAGKSEKRILAGLCGEFEVNEREAENDTRAFIRELSEAGLLTPVR
jgi:hypothetical protein